MAQIPTEVKAHPNRNKRAVFGWTMYDWANSVYSLTITTAVFPLYFHSMARQVALNKDAIAAAEVAGTRVPEAVVTFAGFEMKSIGMLSMAIAIAYIIISLVSPILGSIADYSGKKKRFMMFFCTMGSMACSGLYFFEADTFYLGFWLFVIAAIGYAGGNIFNDAFLPEIVDEDQYDKISARGYSMGYIGSVILLIFNLAMVLKPELFFDVEGRTEGDLKMLASKISFLSVGIWWFGFAMVTFTSLKDVVPAYKPKNYIASGFRELKLVMHQMNGMPALKRYLIAYFCFNMGIQTVMYMASSFGSEELKMQTDQLIISILLIQLVGVAGSFMFAWLSKKTGNFNALLYGIGFWILILIGAWFVTDAKGFYIMGAFVGIVMGGMQALSRATYSKLLPETTDTAAFFSFFSITDKISIVVGTSAFGLVSEYIGTRQSILFLGVFFIIGGIILYSLKFKHSIPQKA